MKDQISPQERLANPYNKQLLLNVFCGVVCLILTILFVWQVIIDITN